MGGIPECAAAAFDARVVHQGDDGKRSAEKWHNPRQAETERAQVDAAIAAFFVKEEVAPAQPATPLTAAEKATQRKQTLARDKLAKQFKTAKVAVVEIAALAGKGYPAPMALDTGAAPKVVSKAVATNKK